MNYIENSILKEGYYEINHPTGLKIYIYPKKDSNSSYAVFGTKYGSIDTQFRIDAVSYTHLFETFTVINNLVPFPSSVSIFNSSEYFFIFGKPIPAPNPSERTLSGAVDQPSFIARLISGIPGP